MVLRIWGFGLVVALLMGLRVVWRGVGPGIFES